MELFAQIKFLITAGTEHILLGLLREGDGVAARVLKNLDVDIEQTRHEILKELDPNFSLPDVETKPATSPEPTPPLAKPSSTSLETDLIDTSQRYDLYCSEQNLEIVVYHNALFKGVKKLFHTQYHDYKGEFVELEQANGEAIFILRSSIIKFSPHGKTSDGGDTAAKEP